MKPKIRFKGFEGEWKTSTIGDFTTSFSGGTPTAGASEFYGGNIPFIRSGEIHESKTELFLTEAGLNNSSAKVVEKGTLLYALYGATSGEVGISKIRGAINQAILAIYPNKTVDKRFLANYLQSHKQKIVGELLQGGQGNLSGALVKSISVTYPNNREQQTISDYVDSLDSQISAATSRLASLKQMKAASLQAMFPQEGETVPKIRFKGFEGEWKTCVLSSIATMHARIGWQNLRKDEFLSSGDYYLITGTDFHDGKISFETCHYIDKERYDQDKNIQLEIDSILITKDGTLGKVAFVDSLDKPATLNAGIFNVRTKDKEIYPKYLFQYLKAPYLMDYVNKNATGGTIKHLNQNMLVNFPVQYPSYKEQVMIGDYLFNLDRQISLQSQRLEKLKQIKSACLDKMFV